jgi:branched-chain amino acid transport system ATP-binding protein
VSPAVVLEAEGLTKSFGGLQAVQGMSFVVWPGEIVALIGPNGAGKSTCFNMLMGQIAVDRGRVRVLGQDVTGWPPRRIWRLGVGRTFQITQILPSFTVRENVQLALLSHRRRLFDVVARARNAERETADRLLHRVGIAEFADRACGLLAYGDLKRVELAIALANRPQLLLMDEPTAGMAPAERIALMELTAGIAKADGVGVLFTEHDMDVVFGHADRIMVMHRGALIAEGRPHEVREDPNVREVYLGSSLDPEPA